MGPLIVIFGVVGGTLGSIYSYVKKEELLAHARTYTVPTLGSQFAVGCIAVLLGFLAFIVLATFGSLIPIFTPLVGVATFAGVVSTNVFQLLGQNAFKYVKESQKAESEVKSKLEKETEAIDESTL